MVAMIKRYKWVDKLTLIKINLNLKQKKIRTILTLLIIILLPILIYILPENYFDQGGSNCLSVLIFDQECYGCGLTRACKHLLHLNFEKAFEYNMLSFIALPLIALLWIKWFFKERKYLLFLYK